MRIPSMIGALAFLFCFNEVAKRSGLFGWIPWLDVPMHIMGGFCIGVIAWDLFRQIMKTKKYPWWFAAVFVAGGVMIIGYAWEAYEWILDITVRAWRGIEVPVRSYADTMKDLFDDGVGALLAFGWVWKNKKK